MTSSDAQATERLGRGTAVPCLRRQISPEGYWVQSPSVVTDLIAARSRDAPSLVIMKSAQGGGASRNEERQDGADGPHGVVVEYEKPPKKGDSE